jgi:hypothetical protein
MIETTRAVARKYGPRIGAAALTLPFTLLTFAQDSSVAQQAKTKVEGGGTDLGLVAGAIVLVAVATWAIMKIVGLFRR